MTNPEIKQALFSLCEVYVQQRIHTARQAMEAAQESANTEEKSSAGDKYETGRAMAQLERDRHAQLLAEAQKLENELSRLNVGKDYVTVQPGCMVISNRGTFFISVSAGKISLDGADYFAVSPASPVATALAGRKQGEEVSFNKQIYQILSIA